MQYCTDFHRYNSGMSGAVVVAACVIAVIGSYSPTAEGSTIYLKSLEIATTHDKITKPTVYMVCGAEGNGTQTSNTTNLPTVVKPHNIYMFEPEIPLMDVGSGDCVKCRLMEHDRRSKDDNFGEIEVCSDSIARTEQKKLSYYQLDQFHAVLSCPDCIMESPAALNTSLSGPENRTRQDADEDDDSSSTEDGKKLSEDSSSNEDSKLLSEDSSSNEDSKLFSEDGQNPANVWWRFVSAGMPGSSDPGKAGNRIWGIVSVQAFSSADCSGDSLDLDEVTYGGGNWSSRIDPEQEGDTFDAVDEALEKMSNVTADADRFSTPGENSKDSDEPDGDLQGEAEEETALYFYTTASKGLQQYKITPSMSCRDHTQQHMPRTTMLGCAEICNVLETCLAFTYNTETQSCYLKPACMREHPDSRHIDVSGLKMDSAGKLSMPPRGNGTSASFSEVEAQLRENVEHWQDATVQVEDPLLGGAYVSLKLAQPDIVQCMRFVSPPRLAPSFPQAARIQSSSDGGITWVTAQTIEPIQQSKQLIKTVSQFVNLSAFETHGQAEDAASPESLTSTEAKILLDQALAHAIEVAMKAMREATSRSGVHFAHPSNGFFFTAGMMAVGAVLACCCCGIFCCKRRKNLRRRAYEDSFRTRAEGGKFLTDIELGASSSRKEGLIIPSAASGLVTGAGIRSSSMKTNNNKEHL